MNATIRKFAKAKNTDELINSAAMQEFQPYTTEDYKRHIWGLSVKLGDAGLEINKLKNRMSYLNSTNEELQATIENLKNEFNVIDDHYCETITKVLKNYGGKSASQTELLREFKELAATIKNQEYNDLLADYMIGTACELDRISDLIGTICSEHENSREYLAFNLLQALEMILLYFSHTAPQLARESASLSKVFCEIESTNYIAYTAVAETLSAEVVDNNTVVKVASDPYKYAKMSGDLSALIKILKPLKDTYAQYADSLNTIKYHVLGEIADFIEEMEAKRPEPCVKANMKTASETVQVQEAA